MVGRFIGGNFRLALSLVIITRINLILDDLLATGGITLEMRRYGELLSWSGVHGASYLIIEEHLPVEAFEGILDALELAMKGGK